MNRTVRVVDDLQSAKAVVRNGEIRSNNCNRQTLIIVFTPDASTLSPVVSTFGSIFGKYFLPGHVKSIRALCQKRLIKRPRIGCDRAFRILTL